MTRYLPPNLLVLFASRDPIDFIVPVERRKMPPYTGLTQYLKFFDDPKIEPPPPVPQTLTKEERRAKKRKEKQDQELDKIKEQLKSWDPHNNPKATDDAFKTLFVGRVSFKTTEHKLKREFEQYGPIKAVRMVYDLDGKPRGYAFIEYERERDMRTAYKEGDAKKIDGRRVLVDVERGRTVKGWKPRRFGGGLGGTRIGGDRENIKFSGRAPPSREDRGSNEIERHGARRATEEPFTDRDRGAKRTRDERDDTGRDRDRERNVRPRTDSSKYEGHDYRREEVRRDEGRRDERRRNTDRGGERFREERIEREDRGHEDDRHNRRHYR